jgi:hypothetical protein
MAKRTVFPVFLPNKGIVLDKPEEFLLQQFSPYSRNMEYYNELLQGRLGLTKFDLAQLNGRVMNLTEFNKFAGTYFLIACTEINLYSYDFSNTRWDILNRQYTTGTITVSAGSLTTVTGSGTTWSTNLAAGDYIKIGSGSVHTGSTWYKILSVDSNTQLTLTSAAATCSGSAYVATKSFTGGTTSYWSTAFFVDDTLGEVIIFTNGTDTPVRWTGSGTVAILTGLATGFTAAKYVDVYKNRVIFLWTQEGGQNQPQRERWSAVADCNSWTDTDFRDFMDEDTWITGTAKLAGYHVVFKDEEAYVGRFVGGDDVFDYDRSTSCVGTEAPFSIVQTKDSLYYYGYDGKFHRWNLLRDEIISEAIFPDTVNFDPNGEQFIFGGHIRGKNQIRWHSPYSSTDYNNYEVVFDYKNGLLQVWQYQASQACCSIGEYLLQTDKYVDDPVWGEYYVDEQEGYWDDRNFLANAPLPLYGGYDGYVRAADVGITDDGTSYTRTFKTVRMNFGMPHQDKRLQKQEIWLIAETAGSVTVAMTKGDNLSAEALTHTVSLVHASKDKIKTMIRWDKEDRDFQMTISGAVHFSLLGFLNVIYAKKEAMDKVA